VTRRTRPQPSKHAPPLSAVERQRRYRTGRSLVSIDISGTNSTLIQDLRRRTGLTTDQVLARALELLRVDLDHASRRSRGRGATAESKRQSAFEAEPPSRPDATETGHSPTSILSAGGTSVGWGRPAARRSPRPAADHQQSPPDDAAQQLDLFATTADAPVRPP
jgi:hypothetical protein